MTDTSINLVVLLLCSILIGVDCKISSLRWKQYGDLNPLVNYALKTWGEKTGLATLIGSNLLLLALLSTSPRLLLVLLGAKMSLAVLQLKSLTIE